MKNAIHNKEKDIPVRSVKKALDLVDRIVLADLRGRQPSLAELAREMDMPPNSSHNLLKTLVACGYVSQPGRGLYAPGVKCRQLGRINRAAEPATKAALAARLEAFADAESEACVLAVLVNGERVVVARADGKQAVRVAPESVTTEPFYAVPTGRMLAAMATAEELRQILDRQGLPGDQWPEVGDEAGLRRTLAAMRKRGWCRIGGRGSDLTSWACPVLDTAGSPWGVVGTFVPTYRCRANRRRELLAALRRLAADLAEAVSPSATDASNTPERNDA